MMDEMRAVLRHREFRLLWLASSASTLGDGIVFIALALYVTEIGTPTDVGLVLAAHALPLVLFVLIGGVWADRLERHRVMVATDVIRALLHGLLAVLIFLGDVPIWAIVVIEAGFGTAEAFFSPAATGLIPQTVPEDELQQANAAVSVVQNASELVGPALATALVLGLGAGWAFAVDALTFVISALLLSRVRPRSRGERAARQPLRAELAIGWRELRSRQWAWVVIAATSVALLLALAPFLTLGPTVAEDQYGSAGAYGAIMVALGGGHGPRLARRPALAPALPDPVRDGVGHDLAAGDRGLRARRRRCGWSAPLFVLVGFGFAMFDVSWDTALQERIPPYALSRVSSFDWMGSLALLPLGYLLAGPLAEAFGAVEVLVVGGVLAFLVQVAGADHAGGLAARAAIQPNSPTALVGRRRLGVEAARDPAGLVGEAAGLGGEADRAGHAHRVLGARDRARAQDGVAAELHRQRGVGGGADAGVEDHGDLRALADQAQVVGVQQALAGADRRAERHHRGAADVLEAAGEDRVVVGVGEDGEALVDELLGGLEQRGRVGQQRVLVADHLELDPVGLERLAGELGGQHRVAGGEAAGGVGEQLDARRGRARRRASRGRSGRCAAARR